MPSSSSEDSDAALGLDAATGELPRGVADVEFFLAPLVTGLLARFDAIDGTGEPRIELGVPRSLPVSILRFFDGGFFMSDAALRLATDDFGAGRFFSAGALTISAEGCVSTAFESFRPPRTLVPYSFCAAAIALRVSSSMEDVLSSGTALTFLGGVASSSAWL